MLLGSPHRPPPGTSGNADVPGISPPNSSRAAADDVASAGMPPCSFPADADGLPAKVEPILLPPAAEGVDECG